MGIYPASFSSSAKHKRSKMETFTFLHLLLLATGAVSYVCKHPDRKCGISDHPYHVRLAQQLLDDPDILPLLGFAESFRVCSGTLVHEQWVLSAGDCYYATNFWYSGQKVKPLKVRFISRGQEHQVIPYDNIKMFRYDSDAESIMLVKLPEPVRNIVTAQLPTSCTRPNIGEKLVGLNCHYSEYYSGRDTNCPLCVDRHVTKASEPFFYAPAIMSVSPFFTCPTDTGGPILRREGSADVLYGVEISSNRFMDVCADPVRQWISETIGED
ncbi:trypsin-1-like [Pygocentrus nattereri]|uniref:trypsin-1-like n=1 Tax=Pygocentrus nattereri TaxID=42514 RepID=UPI001891A19C|nr:trypsin-1-like [Pygocentrus nattereri]